MPLPSPTITNAVKLNRRPPLTTLETRLIATTRSMKLLFSPLSRPPRPPPRSSRRPRPSRSPREVRPSDETGPPAPVACSAIMQSFHWNTSSELQPAFACRVRQGRDAAPIGVAAAVEHDRVDPRGFRALRDELSDPHAVGLLLAVDRAQVGLDRRRGGHRGAVEVVHQLYVDVPRRPVDHQARHLGGTGDLLAQPGVPTQPRDPPGLGHVLAHRLTRWRIGL